MANHSLSDTFILHGSWWLPAAPHHRVRGTLVYTSGEWSELELHGVLRAPHPPTGHQAGNRNHPLILGVTADGELCTLLDNYSLGSSRSIQYPTETIMQRYAITVIFYGQHYNAIEQINFGEVVFRFQELTEWMNNGSVKHTIEENDAGVHAHYTTPASLHIELPSLNATLGLRSEFTLTQLNFYHVAIQHRNALSIQPQQPQHWAWFRRMLFDTADLLTLFVGQPVTLHQIHATLTPTNNEAVTGPCWPVEIYLSNMGKPVELKVSRGMILMPLTCIASQINTIVNAWFAGLEQIRPVTNIFFELIHRDARHDRFEFLGLVQALESFHRSTEPGTYIDEETYAKVWNKLSSSIPDDVYVDVPEDKRSELKQAIKDSTKYAYQFSLRKRLKLLFVSLDQSLQVLICNSTKNFIDRVVTERNYLSHLDQNSRRTPFDESELIPLARRLRIFLTILLLKRLGIESKLIKAQIEMHLPPWD